MQELQSLQHASEEERTKIEAQYKNRIKDMDSKLRSLKSKVRGCAGASRTWPARVKEKSS